MNDLKYLVIEGNIGAGKTSLARKLAADLKGELVLEEFAENTFLPQFYKNKEKYAFPLELSFLAARYNQLKQVFDNKGDKLIISDYHFQKSRLFAGVTLDKAELELFDAFNKIIGGQVPEPGLVIYLKKDIKHLKANINKRGREYEMSIDNGYLKKINEAYEKLVTEYPFKRLIKIESDNMDFINNPDDYATIINAIKH